MTNLKDLQKMAKNKEISKKLLGDEEFKKGFKKILKEENGIEITDEQISEIIKDLEIDLQDEDLLEDAVLENISGGRIDKAKAIKGASLVVGALVGDLIGDAGYLVDKSVRKNILKQPSDGLIKSERREKAYRMLGTAGGAYGGYRLGEYICNKIDKINSEMTEIDKPVTLPRNLK